MEKEFVKLNLILNDSSETIHLGDTLKFKLTLPDNLNTSKRTVFVNSLEEGQYMFDIILLDTVLKRGVKLNTDRNSVIITEGSQSSNSAAVYLSKNKPFTATINIIPPVKGVYTFSIVAQPGKLMINNSNSPIGLKVNFALVEKHWNMLAYYYATYFNTSNADFFASVQQNNIDGYGIYGFRVN
ncbi:MAG TPA: hypothetical protein VK489_09725 [Ferruginibacter sp.]|nr:hypothetical protein [Ferruginibacter sp.]